MANNALTVREQRILGFKSVINDGSIRNRIRTSLGESAGGFIASMLDLYEGETALQNCDPQKVAMECLKAASLKLPIVKSLGFAYVVPYKDTPTFIIGYKGMIQLAQRTGKYLHINADAVYEGEEIKKDRLSGKIEISGQKVSDRAIGYFAYFKLVSGYEQVLYMTVDELQAYGKKYSRAYNNGPWKTNFEEMAKKTVIRRILKYGPMSTEMQEAEHYEAEAAEAAAQAVADRNANKGPALDIPAREQLPTIEVDENGEVLSMSPPPEAPDPDEPGF